METFNNGPFQPTGVPAPNPTMPEKKIGRFRASRIIARESWALLKQDKEMLLFPVMSFFVSLLIIALAGAVFFFLILSGSLDNIETLEQTNGLVNIAIVFAAYFVTTFITIFFETGIITVVKGRLNNQNLTFSDGLRNSFQKSGKIAQWALVSATVGLVLKMISDRSQILGRIVVAILGAAWSILTFFIAPILIVEDLSIKESLQKSASMIKRVWGETVLVNVGIGLYFAFLMFLGVLVFLASLFTGEMVIIVISAILLFLYFVLLAIISSTLSVIYRVVIYEYANNGVTPQGFSPEVIQLAFKQDTRKKGIIGIGGV